MADVRGIVEDLQSVNDGAFLTIQPSTGEEWLIKNIYHGGAAELYKYDGVNEVLVDSDTESGSWIGWQFFATDNIYYRVKNVSGGAALIGYEGVRTK